MALKMTGIATGPLRTLGKGGFVLVVLAGLAGCSGMSSRETTNTAIGAGNGGLGGAILSGGSGGGTAGGAVASSEARTVGTERVSTVTSRTLPAPLKQTRYLYISKTLIHN